MYKTAKSCVTCDGQISDTFPCLVGVRQGENLSPLLFSIYFGDLQLFAHKGLTAVNKMTKDRLDQSLLKYLKLYVLLYADDTVLVAKSPEDLQKSITLMKNYCDLWKLNINVSKTKITIFSRGKTRNIPKFQFGETQLEVTDQYKYLGLIFNFNGKFTKAKKLVYDKGTRAMFALLRRGRQLQSPVDIMIHLFDTLVKPVLLYGSEIWTHKGTEILEKIL